MRNFLILISLICTIGVARAETQFAPYPIQDLFTDQNRDTYVILPIEETNCRMDKKYLGVWVRECPRDAVVTGVDVRVGAGNYLWTYVECERQELKCTKEVTED